MLRKGRRNEYNLVRFSVSFIFIPCALSRSRPSALQWNGVTAARCIIQPSGPPNPQNKPYVTSPLSPQPINPLLDSQQRPGIHKEAALRRPLLLFHDPEILVQIHT